MKHILCFLGACFLFNFLGVSQNLQWAKAIGGSEYAYCSDMETDLQENIYIVGAYNATTDFDPSSGVYNLPFNAPGYGGVFLAKYDSLGVLIWAKQFEATRSPWFYDLELDSIGNLIVTGSFENGTIDMDPSSGLALFTTVKSAIILGKYDNNGNYLWAHSFEGDQAATYGSQVKIMSGGDIIISGRFTKTVDFDPSAGSYNLSSADSAWPDIFFAKYTSVGNFVWAKRIGNKKQEFMQALAVDSNDNIYLVGAYTDSLDVDPSSAIYQLTNKPNGSSFIAKYNNSGDFLWANQILGLEFNSWINTSKIEINSDSSIFIIGNHRGKVDFDPGPDSTFLSGYHILNPSVYYPARAGFIASYDLSGNFKWANSIWGGANRIDVDDITIDSKGNIFIAGISSGVANIDYDSGIGIYEPINTGSSNAKNRIFYAKYNPFGKLYGVNEIINTATVDPDYNPKINIVKDGSIYLSSIFLDSVDVDFGPGVTNVFSAGYTDMFFSKYSPDNCSEGLVEIISKSDLGCSSNGQAVVSLSGATQPYSYSWNTNPVINNDTMNTNAVGVYTVTINDNAGCVYTRSVKIDGPADLNNMDAEVHLSSNPYVGTPGIGLVSTFHLDAFNNSCPAFSGELTFILDPKLTFTSSIPSPDLISGDTLRWNINTMNFHSGHLSPKVYATSSNQFQGKDTLQLQVSVLPLFGDIDTSNNYIHSIAIIHTYHTVDVIETEEKVNYVIYPNPNNGIFKIEINNPMASVVEVVDVFGRLIYRVETNDQTLQFDLSNENNGIYFVRVMDGKGDSTVKKIIKQ